MELPSRQECSLKSVFKIEIEIVMELFCRDRTKEFREKVSGDVVQCEFHLIRDDLSRSEYFLEVGELYDVVRNWGIHAFMKGTRSYLMLKLKFAWPNNGRLIQAVCGCKIEGDAEA